MGFRGVINVILRKQIEMSRSFSLFQPPPPPSPPNNYKMFTRHYFFKFFLFFLMHRLLPYPKKKNFWKKKRLPSTLDMEPSPSTWNPRPSTLDKKIDSADPLSTPTPLPMVHPSIEAAKECLTITVPSTPSPPSPPSLYHGGGMNLRVRARGESPSLI